MTTLHSLGPTPKNLILAHIYPLRRLDMLVHNVPSTLQETPSFLTSPTICSIPKNRMQHTRFEYTVNLPKSQGNAGYIAKPITHSDCIKATISKRQIQCITLDPPTHMNPKTQVTFCSKFFPLDQQKSMQGCEFCCIPSITRNAEVGNKHRVRGTNTQY